MQVTDAPEIHSNGFHVKFDISEGQIGFFLPTIVLPCDIDLFSRLASSDTDHLDGRCWNTCIVLPFRSRFLDSTVVNRVITMFQIFTHLYCFFFTGLSALSLETCSMIHLL